MQPRTRGLIIAGAVSAGAGLFAVANQGPAAAETSYELAAELSASYPPRGWRESGTIASTNVADWAVGKSCVVEYSTGNQESVHPGNALTFVSGSSFTVDDFEGVANSGPDGSREIVAGTEFSVVLTLGQNGVSSAIVSAGMFCPDDEKPPTTPPGGEVPPSSSTTLPPTDEGPPPSSSTTLPPAEGPPTEPPAEGPPTEPPAEGPPPVEKAPPAGEDKVPGTS